MKIKDLENSALKTLKDLLSTKNRNKDNRLSVAVSILEFIIEEKRAKKRNKETKTGY